MVRCSLSKLATTGLSEEGGISSILYETVWPPMLSVTGVEASLAIGFGDGPGCGYSPHTQLGLVERASDRSILEKTQALIDDLRSSAALKPLQLSLDGRDVPLDRAER